MNVLLEEPYSKEVLVRKALYLSTILVPLFWGCSGGPTAPTPKGVTSTPQAVTVSTPAPTITVETADPVPVPTPTPPAKLDCESKEALKKMLTWLDPWHVIVKVPIGCPALKVVLLIFYTPDLRSSPNFFLTQYLFSKPVDGIVEGGQSLLLSGVAQDCGRSQADVVVGIIADDVTSGRARVNPRDKDSLGEVDFRFGDTGTECIKPPVPLQIPPVTTPPAPVPPTAPAPVPPQTVPPPTVPPVPPLGKVKATLRADCMTTADSFLTIFRAFLENAEKLSIFGTNTTRLFFFASGSQTVIWPAGNFSWTAEAPGMESVSGVVRVDDCSPTPPPPPPPSEARAKVRVAADCLTTYESYAALFRVTLFKVSRLFIDGPGEDDLIFTESGERTVVWRAGEYRWTAIALPGENFVESGSGIVRVYDCTK